jgi:hypothetical protein
MKKNKKAELLSEQSKKTRRSFIKNLGLGIVVTSAYTIVSMTNFSCTHDPLPTRRGGY